MNRTMEHEHPTDVSVPAPMRGGLPPIVQWGIVGGLVVVMAMVWGIVWGIGIFLAPGVATVASAAPLPAGSFRPSAAQLAGLKLAPVAVRNFRSEQVTDGKIALDGDLTTPVYSPYSGRVTRLLAKAGDVVAAGQPLFQLEASEFVQGQNDLLAALAGVSAASGQLAVARTNEARQHALYDAKAGALKDWQQSQADLASAEAASRTAGVALAAVENRLRILGKSAKEVAALEAAGRMNPEAVVTAPIRGTVTDRQIGPGEYIEAGASVPQYTIGDLSTLWLVANVREADAPLMRPGDPVEVTVPAWPGRVFEARLSYVAPSVDPNTRRLAVRAELANGDGALKPEMFASFAIVTSGETAAPAVPAEAIVYEGEAARVWVAHPDGTIELRQIRTGRSTDGLVEALAGLQPGEQVVTSGALFIDRAASAD
jgi:cobalt-zinc-cadmium efflux system membrane fusion protein